MKPRPPFLRNWRALEPKAPAPSASGEQMGYMASFADATGLSRLKIAHLRLQPGARSNVPGAYRDEEEFFFVLEGAPDLWIDGHLHGLREGDGIAFNDRTGIAHTLINNTDADVRLFVFGEATRLRSQFHLPLPADAESNATLKAMGKLWQDPPRRKLGPNTARAGDTTGRKRARPDYVAHWRDILEKDEGSYPGSLEPHGIDAPFGRRARFSRIGIHLEVLPAGRRTSWPHAERDEEEFVYVVQGAVDAWIDGHLHPMREGDFVGFEARTNITHVVINNSGEDALLLVGGEANRQRNQFWYPYHPHRDKEIGKDLWFDHPKPKLGPHDGLPDAVRDRLPKAARKNPVAANRAAMKLKAIRTK
ncbi:MAG: cupin domain-containing protein [Rhizomicrobium sp.]